MRRETFKLLILAGVIGFAVLYGMELSSKGIEDVNGAWEQPASNSNVTQQPNAEEDWTLPPRKTVQVDKNSRPTTSNTDDMSTDWDEEGYGIPRNDREPIVDRVSGKTADVLHNLSRNGIRMVVSIFDNVMG